MKGELKKAQAFLKEQFPQGGRVLCAVSGGLDSMCLLHLLETWGQSQGFQVCAAHFNHQLRGAEADRDEAFVRDYCTARGIPVRCGRGDVAEAARQETGLTIEAAGRKLRYGFLQAAAEEWRAGAILTAHHADDNAETMLWNLIRGTGSAGLAGIPPVRGNVMRPLLEIPRAELEDYAAFHGIPHVEDATNADADAASRNAIRHRVLPLLRELNPRAVEHMSAAAAVLRRESQALEQAAERLEQMALDESGALSCQKLLAAPAAVRERVFLRWIAEKSGARQDLTAAHLAALSRLLEGTGGGEITLPYGLRVRKWGGRLALEQQTAPPAPTVLKPDIPCPWGGYLLTLRDHRGGPGIALRGGTEIVTVRKAPAGGFLRLAGSRGARSVKRLCRDRGISPAERDGLPALYLGDTLAAVWQLGTEETAEPTGEIVRFVSVKEIEKAEERKHEK